MYIVVTDCGHFWNHNNPILKKYKESVIVVCLNGQKVTDEYRCFVSPYHGKMMINMLGHVPPVFDREEYKVLEAHAEEFVRMFGNYEDIVFLTDYSEQSCYPFWAFANKRSSNNYHVCAMLGWALYRDNIKSPKIRDAIAGLSSLMIVDSDIIKEIISQKKCKGIDDLDLYMTEYMEGIFPHILNGIEKLTEKSYFDFASMKYIPLAEGFDGIDLSEKSKISDKIDFDITPKMSMLGRVSFQEYPSKEPYIIRNTEQLTARIDGKKICNILREQRIRLAQANNIPFESEECPSIGPCAGTCRKCDSEAAYLRDELEKLPEYERVYPQFDITEEMKNDR